MTTRRKGNEERTATALCLRAAEVKSFDHGTRAFASRMRGNSRRASSENYGAIRRQEKSPALASRAFG